MSAPRWLVALGLLLSSPLVFAYPELIRYGYNNCAACHVSPSGGGMLTSYGRGLSSEVLSTWGNEKTAGVFWGAEDREKLEKWILPGGDIRAVQTYQEDDQSKRAKFIKMQGELQLGWVRDHWGAVGSVGQMDDQKWVPTSRIFYGFWRPRDELFVQAGRFLPAYGLRLPDHVSFTRDFLGFGYQPRDTAEVQWTDELWSAAYSHSKEFATPDPEVADSVQGQIFLAQKYKLAANVWNGRTHSSRRTIAGLWGIFGFTKKFYLLSEADLQWQIQAAQETKSFVSFDRLGYTVFKGFDLIWQSEHLHTDLNTHGSIINRNGPGFQFFPYPHVEVSGLWAREEVITTDRTGDDYAYLLFHYYL